MVHMNYTKIYTSISSFSSLLCSDRFKLIVSSLLQCDNQKIWKVFMLMGNIILNEYVMDLKNLEGKITRPAY